MPQYQTFPDASGSSKSLEKLRALRLPPLTEKSFLDVGCNEGFFCGFAQYSGAHKVVGIDKNKESIELALDRFNNITFLQKSWDDTIEGQFDIILLASALHYANDQEALIHKLVSHLTPTGTLVLEIGLASGPGEHWVTVKRSIDDRNFPTHGKLAAMLEPHAWKIMGDSVTQVGDPTPRVVVHIQKRRPYAFLLMAPSAFGKTTITRFLSTAQGLTCLCGDSLIQQINAGKFVVSNALRSIVQKDFSHTNIAPVMEDLFKQGFGEELVSFWLAQAKQKDVMIDAYVPTPYWAEVIEVTEHNGFIPIEFKWNMISSRLTDRNTYDDQTLGYIEALQASVQQNTLNPDRLSKKIISSIFGKNKTAQSTRQTEQAHELPKDFDAKAYLLLQPDVAQAGVEPAQHYLRHGIKEGRRYK
jgi:SAM-dependent methyltransferase